MITKLLLLCGGPSPERNISLNSARTVYDHLEKEFDIDIVFIDKNLKKFMELILKLNKNRTIIIISHSHNEIKLVANRTFIIKNKQFLPFDIF